MCEPVDDDIVFAVLMQIEGLDHHALDRETDGVPVHVDGEVELLHDRFEAERPTDVGAERESDLSGSLSYCAYS
jgi:hypothetical protein